jgi:hypothetical protein
MDEHDDVAEIEALEQDLAAIERELGALDAPGPSAADAPRPAASE